MMRSGVVVGVLGCLAVPGAACASWSVPETVGPSAPSVSDPAIVLPAVGAPLLSADYRPPVGYFPGRPLQTVTRVYGDRREGVATHLVAAPVTYGARRAAFLRESPRDSDFPATITLGVSFGDASGVVGRFRLLSRRALPGSAALAADRAGSVAVAWAEAGRGSGRVRLALRLAGGRLSRPRTVATGTVGAPSSGAASGGGVTVAAGAGGRFIVAYQRQRRHGGIVQVRSVSAHRLGAPQAVGPQQGLVDLRAAVAANGRAVLAWGTQDVGEEANEPRRVYVALRGADAARFGRARLLDPGGPAARPAGRVALAVGADGSAIAAWSSLSGSYRSGLSFPVRYATAGPATTFGEQQQLAPDGAVGDAIIGADGSALIAWGQLVPPNDQDTTQIIAASRPAGQGAFGAPEAVSPVERAEQPRAAFDPRTGQPIVVWSGGPGSPPGTDADGATAARVLRLASHRP